MKKKLKVMALIVTVGSLLLILVCNLIIICSTSGKSYDDISEIPHNDYGLLLATSPVTNQGTHNYMFQYRVEAAENLLKSGKIDTLIASGGNYVGKEKYGCDEPQAIKDSLVSHGIDPQRIILDYEGTRTQNSIIKAKAYYNLDSVTLISQSYHNPRALYLADRFGLHAVAYNASTAPSFPTRLRNNIREWLARVKMFIDLTLGNKPTYNGQNHHSTKP